MKSSYFKRTGHERYRTAKTNNTYAAIARRLGAKSRLEDQLKKGTKLVGGTEVPLEESDRKRIQKEIEILKGRT